MNYRSSETVDYDEIALQYARNRKLHPEVLRELLSTGNVGDGERVLEVGCGTGNYILAFESALSCSCWGIDPSRQMLRKAEARSKSVYFQVGEAGAEGLQSNAFTFVFSVDLIHHLSRVEDYFLEAYRILKSGGRLCTVTDSEWIIRNRVPLTSYFPETVEIELSRYPNVDRLREIMVQAGFRDLNEKTVEFNYQLTEIEPYQEKAFSCLHLIPESAFIRGISRMKKDLQSGPIPCVSRYLLLWGIK